MTPRLATPLVLIATLSVALSGCPSSHGDEAAGSDLLDSGPDGAAADAGDVLPVDGDRRLIELSDEEWRALCDWLASLPESPTYFCNEATYIGPDAGTCDSCTFYDWRPERCFDPFTGDTTGEVAFWRMQPGDCMATVAMWADCRRDQVEVRCFEAFLSTSACVALRCYPEPADAGVSADGS